MAFVFMLTLRAFLACSSFHLPTLEIVSEAAVLQLQLQWDCQALSVSLVLLSSPWTCYRFAVSPPASGHSKGRRVGNQGWCRAVGSWQAPQRWREESRAHPLPTTRVKCSLMAPDTPIAMRQLWGQAKKSDRRSGSAMSLMWGPRASVGA